MQCLVGAANASGASGNAPLHAKQVLRSLRVPVARHVLSNVRLFLEHVHALARAARPASWRAANLRGARAGSQPIVGLLVVNLLGHTGTHEPKATANIKATSTGHWAKPGSPNAGA